MFSIGATDPRPASAVSFDAGINASSAWAEALENSSNDGDGGELKNERLESAEKEDDDPPPRPARALFDFDGKTEFREL